MVSKNNQQWKQQQEAQRVPHYGLRKLSVGVASVLLSTTLYMGVTAHADTTVETSPQPTVGQPASTAAGTSTGDVTTDVQPTAGQPASTATNSNAPENDVSAKSAPTVLPKQPANATDAQPTATTSGVQPVMNLAVESDNNDLAPKHETVDSQWTIHYVNQADHQQELKAPTVINMQYTRTNTPQSDGTIQYGDWSYVSGSFKQTGTPITVNDSDNPTKEDNVDENGENMDVFTIVAMYPTIAGHTMHNGINGTRLSDNLRNDDRQAAMMSKDTYAEYDVAKERFVAVKFVDDQLFKQQVGQAITLTGRDGDTVNLNLTVPDSDKYRLADGQQLPTTYTFTAGSGDLTIHLAHKAVQREATIDVKLALITEVNIDSIDHTSAVISQTQWGQLDDGLKHGKPEFISPAGVFPLVEAGTLTGHVNYDLVDKEFVSFGNDWTNLNLGGHTYQLPNGDDVVNGVLVGPKDSWGEPLKKYYLKYHPNVDPDYATYPWHGYLSVNVTSDPNGPLAGWNSLGLQGGLAGNKSNILAKANGDRAATAVEMANKTIDVSFLPSPNAFREQDGQLQRTLLVPVVGVYVPYVEKTVTRTINVTTPDGKMTMVKQTATLAKQVNFNKDAHPDWTTGEWASYDAPSVPGYTASQPNVAQQTVTGATEDQTVNITYTANPQTTTVVYQTEDGTPVHTTTVNGQTGQTVTVPNEVPTGWQVVDGKVPSEITFGPDGAPKTVVTIAHSHVTVTPDSPKTPVDKLPDNPDKAYPAGVDETDLNKTVTRTIKVTTPDDQTKTTAQTAKLTRTADVDEVTGVVKYSDWATGEWASYDAPSVPGYTVSQPNVAQQTVTSETEDQTVNITYTANSQTTHVNYVDAQGKLIHTTTVNGQTDQTVEVPSEIPDGWKLVDGQTVPSEVTFGPDGHADTSVKIEHQHVTVTPDAPKTADDQLPDNPTKHYPGGVDEINLNKMVTRTIKIMQPDGTTTEKVQTVHLTRSATVDEVTKEVKYDAWSTGQWDAYEVPTVDGYAPSRETVETAKIDGHTLNQTVTITYKQITHPSVETAIKTLTEHFIYGEGDRQGKVAAPDSQIKLFFKRTNQVTTDGTVVSYGQWELDPSQGTNGYQILSGQWQIPTPGNYDVLRAVAELPNGRKLSVDENLEYHYSSSLAWLNPELSAVDYFADPDFYDVRTEHTTYVQAVHVDLVLRDQDPMHVGDPYIGSIQLTGFADDSRNLTWDEIVAASKHDKVDLTNYELVPDQTVTVDFEPQSPDSILVNLRHKRHQVQTVDHVKVILAPALISNLHGLTANMPLALNSQIDQNGHAKNDKYHQVTVAVPVTLTVDAVTQWILNAKVTPTTVNIQESQYADSDLNGYDYGIASTDDSGEFPFGPDWRQVLAKLSNGYREQLAKLLGVSNDQTLDEAISNSTVETAYFSYPKRNMGHAQQAVTKNQIVIDGDIVSFPAFNDNGPIDHAARLYDENNPLTDEVMSFQILNWHFPKPVTRTINMHLPSGKVETTTQVVDAGKTVAFNDEGSLTLEPTHGPLEWANYEVSTQAGYTPSQAVVAAQLVDDQTTDQTVDIYYTPNQHQINVEYVDDDDHGKVVKTDQVSGKTDQTITVTPSAPASYDLVDDNNRTYTVTSADGQTVQIHVKHHQVTTTEDKTVTRTINVHTPHDGVKAIKQTAELTREMTTDQVTGEKTYGDWTTGQWESYTPEVVPGYTPSTNEVPNANVDGSTGDQMVDVTYIADTQKVEIVYLDDTKDGAVVKTDQVTGKTNETVKVTPDVPVGYELVGKVPGDYTMTANGHQTITVHLVHQTKTTSESKTITRTINVHTPHDGTKVVKQVASLNRDVTTDQVTGEKSYGDWSTAEWDHYAVPAVAGYVPSIEQVTQQVVNGTTTDQTIDVTYSSGEHTAHVNYVDGDGNTVHTTTITGQTDGTVQVPNETPAGWTVIGEPVPNELTFGPDGHADVTVTVDHQHVTVTPDQPKTPTDKLPDNPAKTYPNGVGHDDLNKTITRTIKITTPDGQTKTVEQTAHLTRTADVDEVTGEVTYGKWTTGSWANYDVPTVPGYTPSQATVAEVTVDADTTSQTVKITYTADRHTTHINYVDKNGKVVHTTTVTGQTDQTVKVPNEVPAGWTITGGKAPSELTFNADGHVDVTITVDHQHTTVTPDQPKTPTDKLPDNPAKTYPTGVGHDDLNKMITRTIKATTPDGQTKTVKQTAKLTRTADVDEVTGEVTYSNWSTGHWDWYEVPVVAGYTASQTTVSANTVTATTADQTVNVTYTANQHTSHINYVDKDGKIVRTTTVTGATDQTVEVPNETPTGWTITTGKVPSEVTFGANGHGDVTVTIAHQTVTVTPDQPQTDGTQLPDNPTLTFRGVGEGDLNRTVTRTITLNVPGQAPQVITQTVRLTRTATVDEVTGEVTYGDWTTGRWGTYAVPTVDGYTADQTTIPAVEVTSATTSQEMVINYTAVPTTPSDHQPAAKQATTATPNTPLQTPVTKAQAQKLPQTGETQNVLAPIGLALLGILSGFSLFAKKRKAGKDDKHQS